MTQTGIKLDAVRPLVNRALLVIAIIVAISVGGMILAQHAGEDHLKAIDLSKRDIIEKLDGKSASVTMREVTFEPGQKDAVHRHTGPVFGYVLEGEYEIAMDDEPLKIYKAGETFYEATGACTGCPATRAIRREPVSWQ